MNDRRNHRLVLYGVVYCRQVKQTINPLMNPSKYAEQGRGATECNADEEDGNEDEIEL